MNKRLKILIITLTISFSAPLGTNYRVFAQTDKYTLGNMQKYRLVESYTIKNDPNEGAMGNSYDLTTIVKMGTDLNSPYIVNVSDFKASEGTISKDANGVYVLTLPTKTELKIGETVTFNIEREFETGTIQYNIDKSKVTSDYSELPNYQEYLKPTELIQVNDPLIQQKAIELTKNVDNPYDKAYEIFKYVNLNTNYDYNIGEHSNKGALSALTYHEGVCQDYAQLFVALCRASGIPARTVSGYRNVKELTDTIDLTNRNHMWAEFYLPGYGWVIAEPTITSTVNGTKVLAEEGFAKQLNEAEHIAEQYGRKDNIRDMKFHFDQSGDPSNPPKLQYTDNIKIYRINESEIQLINLANELVKKAEQTKLQEDLDNAKNTVNSLKDGLTKNELNARLDAVQKVIDADKTYQTQLTAATNAVVKAEGSKLQSDVDSARTLVNALRPTDKSTLGARLDTVQRFINDSNNNKSKEDTAISSVRTAEYNLTRESYNSAVNAVDNLENGTTKTSLEYRLNNVLRAIQSRENSQRNEYQNPIYRTEEQSAINLVTVCENNITREGYNSALNAVNNLPYGSVKTSLQYKLYQLQADLNNKDAAVNAVANLYNNLTVDNYEKTVKLVYNLKPEIPERKDLLDRLDSMLMGLVVKNNTSDSKEVKEVLSSINNAERNLNSLAYNQAYSQVGKLDDSKFRELKPLLTDRLSVVNNKINDRKLKSKFPQLIQYPFLETRDTGKTWRISFNKQLDKETVNTNNIYITDSRGNNIKCIVYSNGNTLSVTPVGGYIPNEQYAIYINSNVKSIDNKSISNGYYVTFEVAK